MLPLFSDAGLQRLDDIVGPGLLCVFDFDGTLAPIVEEPQKARLPQDVLQRLSVLSTQVPLAILTGRSVADIRPRLAFEPDYLIGNHGAEGMPGWHLKGDYYRQLCQSWKGILSSALKNEEEFGPSVWIEDKAYSLTVHYRARPGGEQVREKLKALFAQAVPAARVIAGKSIFNLVPANAPHKGDALEKLMEISGARHAIYVGDDVTDEDVFAMRRPDIMTVRVEYLAGSAAEFYLPHWPDIVALLDELIKRLQELQASGVRLA
jgi:trehalose 6-phosphate phosphatase